MATEQKTPKGKKAPKDEKAQRVIARLDGLKKRRELFEPMWDEVVKYISPYRSLRADSDKEGQEPSKDVYDGAPIVYLSALQDGFLSHVTSRSERWLALRMGNRELEDLPGVRGWLQLSEVALYSAFQRSNFYESMHEYFGDAAGIGTATLYVEEDIENARIDYLTCHPWEVYIDEDARGRVDTVFRKYELTYRQIERYFKDDDLPEKTKTAAKNNPNGKAWVLHAVYPRDLWIEGYASAKNKRYASEYYLLGDDLLIREGGYDSLPYAVWRWRKNTNELYGRSPACDAIRDIKRVNVIGKTMLQDAEMADDPPWNVPAELKGKVRIRPRGMNYYEETNRTITPVFTGVQYPFGKEEQDRIDNILRKHFKAEFFSILADAERTRTATEVIELQGEKAASLGATLGRLENEALNPIVDLTWDIEVKAGRIPPPPAVLVDSGGQTIDVEYVGLLFQAQRRSVKTQGTARFLEFAGQIGAMNPEAVLVNLDWRSLLELGAENLGAAVEVLKERTEVEAEQAAIAEAQQEQAQFEKAGAMADAVPKLSKAVEEGSPLDKLEKAGAL